MAFSTQLTDEIESTAVVQIAPPLKRLLIWPRLGSYFSVRQPIYLYIGFRVRVESEHVFLWACYYVLDFCSLNFLTLRD